MKTIRDAAWTTNFLRRHCGVKPNPGLVADIRIEISGIDRWGLLMVLRNPREPLVEMMWRGGFAHVVQSIAPMWEALECADSDAIDRTVTRLLRKHDLIDRNYRSALEYEPHVDLVLKLIGYLGDAIRAQQWGAAVKMWNVLEPLHADWFKRNPALVEAVARLRQHEAFESQTAGIH